ncbi:alkaline-phosphatase-like protein [Macrophomina phaseolina]|uniref:Alkaline-phosphatase-like protein n=1 Tax=Macrophomina phaseolina TaxID=35725 RepID=A0ABQ8G4Z9_9PEZI|nr:alkaline-phosphatase-like protein [Macrophomina phaseolina]
MAQPKNILLLIADDLGREQTGCYGCKSIKTPNLDSLSASGSKFDMAFTSTASCSGSRTVIYTGLHTHETGSYGLNHERNGFQTFPNVETAPQVFNRLGYRTGILGKVHVGPGTAYPWEIQEQSESRNVAHMADRASVFFQGAQADNKPFFLTVGFVDPHRQLHVRGGFGNVQGNHDSRLQDHLYKPEDVEVPSFLSDIPEVRQELVEYYRAITRMDQGVGRILDALDAAGARHDTLVLFLSDNGPPFINSKTTLFEAGVRLPFLMRAPGISTPGTVNPSLVSYTDILPTFLDWAGHGHINAPEGKIQRRGRSILPILSTTTPEPGWDCVFGSHTFHEITNYWPTRYMRDCRYKYHRNVCWKLDFPFAMDLYASLSFEGMRNAKPPMIGQRRLKDYIRRPPEELYDLENDPLEVENLAGRDEARGVLKEMREALEEWQRETRDLWLWRDGTPLVLYRTSNYAREGLRIPDRFDFDTENPSTRDVEIFPLEGQK